MHTQYREYRKQFRQAKEAFERALLSGGPTGAAAAEEAALVCAALRVQGDSPGTRRVRLHARLYTESLVGAGEDDREHERRARFEELAAEVLCGPRARFEEIARWWNAYRALDFETRERRDMHLFGGAR